MNDVLTCIFRKTWKLCLIEFISNFIATFHIFLPSPKMVWVRQRRSGASLIANKYITDNALKEWRNKYQLFLRHTQQESCLLKKYFMEVGTSDDSNIYS